MACQNVFRRYELKYLLDEQQHTAVMKAVHAHMIPDRYAHSAIRSLYFDTDNYRLARHSIEKPVYKEKLRLRSYGQAGPGSTVFVELKKKYQKVVYKRRIPMQEQCAMAWLQGEQDGPDDSQISQEIGYFLRYYGTLHPVVFLSYERDAYRMAGQEDLRVTFDHEICGRLDDLSLCCATHGKRLLAQGMTLMEIKCAASMPLWMAHTLTEAGICRASFSKYGIIYQREICPRLTKGAMIHA